MRGLGQWNALTSNNDYNKKYNNQNKKLKAGTDKRSGGWQSTIFGEFSDGVPASLVSVAGRRAEHIARPGIPSGSRCV